MAFVVHSTPPTRIGALSDSGTKTPERNVLNKDEKYYLSFYAQEITLISAEPCHAGLRVGLVAHGDPLLVVGVEVLGRSEGVLLALAAGHQSYDSVAKGELKDK